MEKKLKPMTYGFKREYTGKRVLKVKIDYNTFHRIKQLCAYMEVSESELIEIMSLNIPIDLMDKVREKRIDYNNTIIQ